MNHAGRLPQYGGKSQRLSIESDTIRNGRRVIY